MEGDGAARRDGGAAAALAPLAKSLLLRTEEGSMEDWNVRGVRERGHVRGVRERGNVSGVRERRM